MRAIFLLVFCLSFFTIQAQMVHIYDYDKTGNRISRNVIYLRTSPAPGNSTTPDSLSALVSPSEILTDKRNKVADKVGDTTIELFPNPTQDQITISFNEDSFTFDEIRIYDSQGKIIYQEARVKAPVNLHFNNFRPGNYTIFLNLNGQVKRYPVIKL